MSHRDTTIQGTPPALLGCLALAATFGCAAAPEELMDTPVLYQRGTISPFEHLAAAHRTPCLDLLFATDRRRVNLPQRADMGASYGNGVSAETRLGHAVVRFGEDLSWSELEAASLGPRAGAPVTLHLERVRELGRLGTRDEAREDPEAHGHDAFAALLDARAAMASDPDVVVCVHGAKVDSYRCIVRSAELTHFAGRDFTTVVFDWPSHPQILSYVAGGDVGRAEHSAASLVRLLELIAHDTRAERVHVLGYSAGAKVVTHALSELRRAHPELDAEALRATFRIGAVVIAAGDIELERFLERVHDVHDLAERVCVLSSDADGVLRMAERVMGGGERLGELRPGELGPLAALERVEVIDVSAGQAERGFDIGGHHYWYRHPWVSSDLILNLRTDRPPGGRGLLATDADRVWELPGDYPERAHAAALAALQEEWLTAAP